MLTAFFGPWKTPTRRPFSRRVKPCVEYLESRLCLSSVPGTSYDGAGDTSNVGTLSTNQPPTADAGGPYEVSEGATVVLDGSASRDAEQDAGALAFAWDLDGDGVFGETGNDAAHGDEEGAAPTFAAAGLDGPRTLSVTLRVTDTDGATAFDTATVTVQNANPTGVLSNGGTVTEGSAGSVAFADAHDASPADADFRYAFDFDNDGDFEIGDGTYVGSSDSAAAVVPASFLADGPREHTVRGRVLDKDGGFTDYTTTFTVTNVAPTGRMGATSPELGGDAKVRFFDQQDPSPVDAAAGFLYHFDFDDDGVFEVVTSRSLPVDVPASYLSKNGPGKYPVRGRLEDKDGGFTDYTVLVNVYNGDTFNRTDGSALGEYWTEVEGDLGLSGGQLTVFSATGLATRAFSDAADVEVSASMDVTAPGVHNAGLVVRYRRDSAGASMYWAALVKRDGAITAEIWRCVNGTWTRMSQRAVSLPDHWHWLRFQVIGNNLKLFLADVWGDDLVGYAYDHTLTGPGAVGLRGSANARFDNFNTYAVTPAAASLPFADGFDQERRDGQLDPLRWQGGAGNFVLDRGRVRGAAAVNLATVHGLSAADVQLQLEVDLSDEGERNVGLVARYTSGPRGASMYWGALVKHWGAYTAEIWRCVDGAWTLLTRGAVAGSAGTGTLTFQVGVDELRLLFDGRPIALAGDAALTDGGVGVRGSSYSAFDNFQADPFSPPPETALGLDAFSGPDLMTLFGVWRSPLGDFFLLNDQARGSFPVNVAVRDGVHFRDVRVGVDVFLPSRGVDHAGLVLRYGGDGDRNMYWGALVANNGVYTADIWRNVNGVWTLLARRRVETGVGSLEFRAEGDALRLTFNGRLVAFATDSALPAGSVGIRATDQVPVDNFWSYRLRLPAATLPHEDALAGTDGTPLADAWQTPLGGYAREAPGARGLGPVNLAILRGVRAADVAVAAEVDLPRHQAANVGLVLRHQGPGDRDMYWGALVTTASGLVYADVWRNVNGDWKLLWRSSVDTAPTGTLRFQAVGDLLLLTLNGRIVNDVRDTTFAAGGVGFRSSLNVLVNGLSAEAVQAPTATAPPFADAFTGPTGGPLSDDWYSTGNFFRLADSRARSGFYQVSLSAVRGLTASDVTVSADVALTDRMARNIGLAARYGGAGDRDLYWGAVVSESSGFSAQIWKNVAGTWTRLDRQTLQAATGTLRFEVIGDSLKLFLNDVLAAAATDGSLTAGGVGLRGSNEATADNFAVR